MGPSLSASLFDAGRVAQSWKAGSRSASCVDEQPVTGQIRHRASAPVASPDRGREYRVEILFSTVHFLGYCNFLTVFADLGRGGPWQGRSRRYCARSRHSWPCSAYDVAYAVSGASAGRSFAPVEMQLQPPLWVASASRSGLEAAAPPARCGWLYTTLCSASGISQLSFDDRAGNAVVPLADWPPHLPPLRHPRRSTEPLPARRARLDSRCS